MTGYGQARPTSIKVLKELDWGKEHYNPYIFYHGSDAKRPFNRFKTTEVWFDIIPRDYGTLDVEVQYKWKRPFVTIAEDAGDYGVTQEQAEENSEQYKAWGGEVNPQSFENMRELGYDLLVDYEGRAALHPERIRILRWITREGKITKDYRSKPKGKGPRRKAPTALKGIK